MEAGNRFLDILVELSVMLPMHAYAYVQKQRFRELPAPNSRRVLVL